MNTSLNLKWASAGDAKRLQFGLGLQDPKEFGSTNTGPEANGFLLRRLTACRDSELSGAPTTRKRESLVYTLQYIP